MFSGAVLCICASSSAVSINVKYTTQYNNSIGIMPHSMYFVISKGCDRCKTI